MANGSISTPKPVESGTPQGSCLSPFLFSIFVAGVARQMEEYEKKVKEMEKMKPADRQVSIWSLLFADDNKCTGSNHTEEDTDILQKALNLIYQWTDNNNMVINSIKTFGMRIGTANYNHTYKAPNKKEI